ncbi:hypothetical protein IFM89_039828 [Coptis chinensis]|uniref:Uncharacterized protein n=1 Tax=Coptis chinensis TaxID=261450 RepID=A0A835GUG4_9MAGN|nr:hypothetical protein IFM89_039828 [Coptis chinensis]
MGGSKAADLIIEWDLGDTRDYAGGDWLAGFNATSIGAPEPDENEEVHLAWTPDLEVKTAATAWKLITNAVADALDGKKST